MIPPSNIVNRISFWYLLVSFEDLLLARAPRERGVAGRRAKAGLMRRSRMFTRQSWPLASFCKNYFSTLGEAPHPKCDRLPEARPVLGACPAGQSPPGCASPHAGKPRRSPRPGAPGFGGAFAILKPESADWISWSAL